MQKMKKYLKLFNILFLVFVIGCSDAGKTKNNSKNYYPQHGEISKFKKSSVDKIIFERSDYSENIPVGSTINFTIKPVSKNILPDSLYVIINGRITDKFDDLSNYAFETSNLGLGRSSLKFVVFFNDFTMQEKIFNYILLSDIDPEIFSFKVINTYPHDPKAYTQGLVWESNILYEGTGKNGASSLRKYNFEKNEILQSINLSKEIFGEGICIFNDKIIQLTWSSNKGFVYNKSDFRLLREFTYFTEGWGLTNDGKNLIMSDGSNILYFLNPEYFTEEKRIEVYDNKGKVDSLNELEYIDTKIYANVYGQDYIVIIDPVNGKVTGKIMLEKLRPLGTPNDMEHVLNGIAHHNKPNHLLVTGKYWPKLFEIEVISK